MGKIYDSHGQHRFSVEERSESFYLKAGYGYGLREELIRKLEPGQDIIVEGSRWRYHARFADYALLKDPETNDEATIELDTMVDIADEYVFYEDNHPKGHALGEYWNWREGDGLRGLSPEIELADVPAVLAAIADLEACPSPVRDAIRKYCDI